MRALTFHETRYDHSYWNAPHFSFVDLWLDFKLSTASHTDARHSYLSDKIRFWGVDYDIFIVVFVRQNENETSVAREKKIFGLSSIIKSRKKFKTNCKY